MELQTLETYSDTIAKIAVPLAIVCWLAYLSVDQFYFFADNEQLINDLKTSQPARAANNNPAPIKLNQATLNLFGESGKARVKEVVAAPETRLNLELQGVFTNNNPEFLDGASIIPTIIFLCSFCILVCIPQYSATPRL